MRNNAVEDGWQRFLDRLRRLWGRLRDAKSPNGPVNAAVGHVGR